MKNLFVMAIMAFTLAACSTNESKVEKAIADYVQTDKRGTWTDLQFQAISIGTSNRTVADSLEILNSEFEVQRTEYIESQQKSLAYWQSLLSDNPASRDAERYNENIGIISNSIDSIKQVIPYTTESFNGLAPDKVLAIVAKCRYSYIMPGMEARKERTETFILSLDGKEVIGKENHK